ncbi:MAG TPA: histidine phosphatase family protein [Gaiellaceae bacterium]|nr:histidine phosphatase family protein [Gaiellaceae bacterium]
MLLLRHASAGERLSSASLDRARRLDRVGRADARLLPESLVSFELERIVSSPHARCVETVRGVALARGLRVEERDELLPAAPLEETLALLAALPEAALVCTHREVFQRLFDGDVTCEKGAAWLVERREGRLAPVAYLPSPASQERTAASSALV